MCAAIRTRKTCFQTAVVSDFVSETCFLKQGMIADVRHEKNTNQLTVCQSYNIQYIIYEVDLCQIVPTYVNHI